MRVYDYNKENFKVCPVCGKTIDYHIDGFIRYKKENLWVCRDHTIKETELALGRTLTKKERETGLNTIRARTLLIYPTSDYKEVLC